MRDRTRIPKTLQLIEHYWLKVPDWRLGQLIENLKTFSGIDDLYYIEDDSFIQIISDFFEALESEEFIQIK